MKRFKLDHNPFHFGRTRTIASIGTVAIVFFLFSCGGKANNEYTVSGQLKNITASTVYLEESSFDAAQSVIVDSASVQKNGAYDLSTLPKEETIYSLRLDNNRFPFVSFI